MLWSITATFIADKDKDTNSLIQKITIILTIAYLFIQQLPYSNCYPELFCVTE